MNNVIGARVSAPLSLNDLTRNYVIASTCTPYATATGRLMNRISRFDVLRDAPSVLLRTAESPFSVRPEAASAANRLEGCQTLIRRSPNLPSVIVEPTPTVVIVRPTLKFFAQPVHPSLARQFGKEATVELRVWVDAAGKVTRAELAGKPVGFGFDESARQVALLAVFEPGRRNGEALPMETNLTVRFVQPK